MNGRTKHDYTMLQHRVAVLKLKFGDKKIRKALKRYLESRTSGRPTKWTQIRLLALWFIVQANIPLGNNTVKGSCSVLESQGGIFDALDCELSVRNRLVSSQSSIHRLYYEAEAVFDDIKPVNDCGGERNKRAPTLREKLCRLASEMGARGIFMCPVISIAELFILECSETDKRPSEIIDCIDLQWLTVDFSALSVIPDGDNLWRIKGICS
jgi:hypothetical protein